VLNGGSDPGTAPLPASFVPTATLLPPSLLFQEVPQVVHPLLGAGLPYDPAPDPSPFALPLDLQLNLDRATPRPLKLSNTEGSSDGSSVERLYKDFLSPKAPSAVVVPNDQPQPLGPE
jgi:hypothetical protein